jgi:hypothetical protein
MAPPRRRGTGPHVGGHPGGAARAERTWLSANRASLGEVWRREGRRPGDGLTVTPTPDGAVIHLAGRPAPAPPPLRGTPATRGRTLHIAAGVDLTEVGAFVDALPADLRPANYTVAPGVTFDRPRDR